MAKEPTKMPEKKPTEDNPAPEERRYKKRLLPTVESTAAVMLASGMTVSEVADAVDRPRSRIYAWLKEGRELADSVKLAEARELVKLQNALDTGALLADCASQLREQIKKGEIKGQELAIVYGILADKFVALQGVLSRNENTSPVAGLKFSVEAIIAEARKQGVDEYDLADVPAYID